MTKYVVLPVEPQPDDKFFVGRTIKADRFSFADKPVMFEVSPQPDVVVVERETLQLWKTLLAEKDTANRKMVWREIKQLLEGAG